MNHVGKFRRRAITVEAIRWTGKNWIDVFDFTEKQFEQRPNPEEKWDCVVYNRITHTWTPVGEGDWIIRSTQGHYEPCDNAIFWETYEQIGAIL